MIGSIYQTPNTPAVNYINHIKETVSKIKTGKKNPEIILEMDHNCDLLKSESYKSTHDFLDTLLD